jgi:hypothetical protein
MYVCIQGQKLASAFLRNQIQGERERDVYYEVGRRPEKIAKKVVQGERERERDVYY